VIGLAHQVMLPFVALPDAAWNDPGLALAGDVPAVTATTADAAVMIAAIWIRTDRGRLDSPLDLDTMCSSCSRR
jgi:hypothetical protein